MNLLFLSGRGDRYEYWLMLSSAITYTTVTTYIVVSTGVLRLTYHYGQIFGFGELTVILLFVIMNIPSAVILINASVRRYHDLDKSGYWSVVFFIPILGLIWQIAELGFSAGTNGANKFGVSPREFEIENNPYRKKNQRKGVGELAELINL